MLTTIKRGRKGGPVHSSRLLKIVNHQSRQLIFEFHGSREITRLTRASFTNKPPHSRVFLLYKAHRSLLMFHLCLMFQVIVWGVSISQVQVLRASSPCKELKLGNVSVILVGAAVA